MDDRLKRRLIGAAVLVSLAVIFVPMMIEDEPVPTEGKPVGTIPPRENLTFKSQVLKDEIAVPTDAPPPGAGAETEAPPHRAEPVPPIEPVADEPAAPAPPAAPAVAEPAVSGPAEKPKPPPTQVAKVTPPPAKAPAVPAPKITTWIVQVGNYSSREKADGVARQLRGKGLEVFIEPIGSPASLFRVAVGPEEDKKRAEALIPRIEAVLPGASKPFIRSYP